MVKEDNQAVKHPRKGRTKQVNHEDWATKHRVLNKTIMDKIVGDPHFREALLADSQKALRSAGLEDDLNELDQHDAVMARQCDSSCIGTCNASCKTMTCVFTISC
jgi:hypothetical protein